MVLASELSRKAEIAAFARRTRRSAFGPPKPKSRRAAERPMTPLKHFVAVLDGGHSSGCRMTPHPAQGLVRCLATPVSMDLNDAESRFRDDAVNQPNFGSERSRDLYRISAELPAMRRHRWGSPIAPMQIRVGFCL